MPYIDKEARKEIHMHSRQPATAGELNFVISDIVDEFICLRGGVNYATINEAIGALECAKMELYRRIAAPYEDRKLITNGEVYTCRG